MTEQSISGISPSLFYNAKAFTATDESHFASAFRIDPATGKFAWVGDTADLSPTELDSRDAVDLGGKVVLPGLLDVHTHPALLAMLADAVPVMPPEVVSLEGLLAALRTDKGKESDWLEAYGFDESFFPEGRKPNRHDLDSVSSTRPILVRRCDGHTAVCNSVALKLAGITKDTEDPHGARFERNEDGEPNGVLTEVAAVQAVARCRPDPSFDDMVVKVASLDKRFLERGIVALCDLFATFVDSPLKLFREAAARYSLRSQMGLYLGWEGGWHPLPTDLTEEDRVGRIRVTGIKVFLDGAYSNRTAWTEDAYPGTSCNHGISTLTTDDLKRAGDWARRNKVQLAVHAMGDRALNTVMDLFGNDEPWMTGLPSIRLEHCTLFTPEMIERITSCKMTFAIVSHTIFFFAEYNNYDNNLSASQFKVAYPIRSFYEKVPITALASDCPATAWADADNIFISVKAAVTRRAYNGKDIGQAEAITVPQALLLYTSRAAAVAPLGNVGKIAEGFEGSFVVLDRDVFEVAADEIDRVKVNETWIAGQLVYTQK